MQVNGACEKLKKKNEESFKEFYNYDLKKLSDEWNLIDYNLGKDKTIVVDKKRMNELTK